MTFESQEEIRDAYEEGKRDGIASCKKLRGNSETLLCVCSVVGVMVVASCGGNYLAAAALFLAACLVIYSYVADKTAFEAIELARECNELVRKSQEREERLLKMALRENHKI